MNGKAGSGLLLVVLTPVLVFALIVAFILFLGGGSGADAACNPGSDSAVAIDPESVPDEPIAGWDHPQLVNAAYIIQAGADLGLSVRDQTIAVMTAMGESSLTVLEHGDDAGPDSRGLFQQRDSWGSLEQRLDPYESSVLFYTALTAVEDRDVLQPTIVAHTVQVNEDPFHYEPFWDQAVQIVEGLGGEDVALSETGGGQSCSSDTLTPGEVNEDGWAEPNGGPVTSGYGYRLDPVTGSFSKLHAGTDLAAGCGSPIWAANDGVVVRAGDGYDAYGAYMIEIDHGGGVLTRYYHLLANGVYVDQGDQVTGGQQIGAEGDTGWVTGCHLHFEVTVDGQNVDPEQYMSEQGITLG